MSFVTAEKLESIGVLERMVRGVHYREAADHLDRRAPQQEALGHYTEAQGYRAAAAELRRLATTPPAGPATGETT